MGWYYGFNIRWESPPVAGIPISCTDELSHYQDLAIKITNPLEKGPELFNFALKPSTIGIVIDPQALCFIMPVTVS